MSKRLDILGARIFGASVCHAQKYLQPFRKCPNVWTKSPILAIMHKHKPYIPSTYACICAFCYFINFLHTFLDIFIISKQTKKQLQSVSNFGKIKSVDRQPACRNGRRGGLKIHWWQHRAGSSPAAGRFESP